MIALSAVALGVLALVAGYLLGRPPTLTLPPESLVVTVVPVGQGEAAWIKTPDSHFILIGSGPPGAGPRVASSLKAAGARRVDLLVLPYPYAEALGGAPGLLGQLPVAEAIDNGWGRLNSHQQETQQALRRQGVSLRAVQSGQSQTLGGAQIEFLAPGPARIQRSPEAANNSLVVRVRWGATSFLFMGGCERAGEEALLSRLPDLSANWLRLARFGTREATSPELLRAVAPEFAVLSLGANRGGYPHAETLERLSATGATVARTDQSDRDLVFVSDGQQVRRVQ